MMRAMGVQSQDSVTAYQATNEEWHLHEHGRRSERGFATGESDLENGMPSRLSAVSGTFQTTLFAGAG